MDEAAHTDAAVTDTRAGLRVVDDVAGRRYELRRGAELLSFADYRTDGEVLVIPYVETDPAYRGHGFSAHLLDHVVADALRRGLRIRPICSYAASVLRARPDAGDVLERR